jgi:hypothetical protein
MLITNTVFWRHKRTSFKERPDDGTVEAETCSRGQSDIIIEYWLYKLLH